MLNTDRSTYIGGSDIAAVLGISPWKTPYQLWEEKTGAFVEEATPEREEFFRWGKRLEPVVIEHLEAEGMHICGRNTLHGDAEYPFLRCEIDFEYVIDRNADWYAPENIANGDVKTAWRKGENWGEPGTDQMPAYYAAQFYFGQMVTGRQHTTCATMIGTRTPVRYELPRDNEIIATIRDRAVRFWQDNVLADVPPPAQTSQDAERMIARFDGVTLEVTDELRGALTRLKGIKAAQKRLQDAEELQAMRVKTAMALHNTGQAAPGRYALVDSNGEPLATWNEVSRKGYTVQPSKSRQFRITNAA